VNGREGLCSGVADDQVPTVSALQDLRANPLPVHTSMDTGIRDASSDITLELISLLEGAGTHRRFRSWLFSYQDPSRSETASH
jgi:hypothetical protein